MNGGRGGPRDRNTREEERSLAIAVWSTQLYGQWASRQPPSGPRADELGAAHRRFEAGLVIPGQRTITASCGGKT